MGVNLLSSTSRVEAPFIIINIAGTTFGSFSKKNINDGIYTHVKTQYPNYMTSLNITKINGALNTYTLVMTYAITQDDDPNLLEKVFAKAGYGGVIKLSYGDASAPSYIYKEEEAIITKVRSNMNAANSSIIYTVECISRALSLNAGSFNFPRQRQKPSDVIKKILYNDKYSLLEIFYGMNDKEKVLSEGLIASDDIVVDIEAKTHITILEYLKYLVSCMTNGLDIPNTIIKNNRYALTVYDDISGKFLGPYFKVTRVDTKLSRGSLDTYELDIGYPGANMVTNFQITDDEMYSILYKYSGDVKQPEYGYYIDNNGNISYEYSPIIANDPQLFKMTQADRTWWTTVTQYPIQATLTIKGLLRPSILMSYIKLNTYFYGKKHVSSGYYIITKQVDTIDASGYKTTLNLVRIAEDS